MLGKDKIWRRRIVFDMHHKISDFSPSTEESESVSVSSSHLWDTHIWYCVANELPPRQVSIGSPFHSKSPVYKQTVSPSHLSHKVDRREKHGHRRLQFSTTFHTTAPSGPFSHFQLLFIDPFSQSLVKQALPQLLLQKPKETSGSPKLFLYSSQIFNCFECCYSGN